MTAHRAVICDASLDDILTTGRAVVEARSRASEIKAKIHDLEGVLEVANHEIAKAERSLRIAFTELARSGA